MNKTTNKNILRGQKARDKIMDFLKRNEVTISPMSYAEIGQEIGQASASVVKYHLGVLESEGKIKRINKLRGIKVLDGVIDG